MFLTHLKKVLGKSCHWCFGRLATLNPGSFILAVFGRPSSWRVANLVFSNYKRNPWHLPLNWWFNSIRSNFWAMMAYYSKIVNIPNFNFIPKKLHLITANNDKLSSKVKVGVANLVVTTVTLWWKWILGQKAKRLPSLGQCRLPRCLRWSGMGAKWSLQLFTIHAVW